MKLDYILLKNYRQYQKEKIIFSDPEKNRNFTIIQGANGTGKTNILNAVTWCLYGKELHMGTKYRGLPLVNTCSLNHMKSGEKCTVEVEMQMFDEDNQKIIIHRKLGYQKNEQGNIRVVPEEQSNCQDGSKVEMIRQIRGDMIYVQDPVFIINKMIPEPIEGYFFFDGEQLNDYFKQTSGEHIKEAVFRISQLALFEKLIEHLSSRKRDFIKTGGELSSKAVEISSSLETYTKSRDQHLEKVKEFQQQKVDADKKVEEYSEKLRTGPDFDVVKLESECREIEKELEQLEDELKDLTKEKNNYLINNAPIIFGYKAIKKVITEISKREEAGDIPSDYKRDFIGKLLKNGECICGADISKENNCRKNVKKYLESGSTLDDLSSELTKLFTTLTNDSESISKFKDQSISYGKRITRLDGLRKSKSETLQKKKEMIGESKVDQIKLWQSKKEEYRKIRDDLFSEISTSRVRAENADHKIQELTSKLEQELEKEEKSREIGKKLKFIDHSLTAATEIKNQIMSDLRKEIEKKTEEQFFELIWKKDTYKEVKIDDNYNISVMHQSGLEGVGTLSAGERQVLALSFMAALNNVSGFNIPILIDTPLGRISKDVKTKIANNLPNYLKEKQVGLLVIDEEYTSEVRNKLSKRVGKEYRIDFKETPDGSYSKVIPYD